VVRGELGRKTRLVINGVRRTRQLHTIRIYMRTSILCRSSRSYYAKTQTPTVPFAIHPTYSLFRTSNLFSFQNILVFILISCIKCVLFLICISQPPDSFFYLLLIICLFVSVMSKATCVGGHWARSLAVNFVSIQGCWHFGNFGVRLTTLWDGVIVGRFHDCRIHEPELDSGKP
jgi:hypothetical protein